MADLNVVKNLPGSLLTSAQLKNDLCESIDRNLESATLKNYVLMVQTNDSLVYYTYNSQTETDLLGLIEGTKIRIIKDK